MALLGSSTGGPFALAEILSRLPASLKTTIVIVQHVDAAFAPGLGQWLSQHAGRKVELVRDGMELTVGKSCFPARMIISFWEQTAGFITPAEPRAITYRPSVDVFFKSVAASLAAHGSRRTVDGDGSGWC